MSAKHLAKTTVTTADVHFSDGEPSRHFASFDAAIWFLLHGLTPERRHFAWVETEQVSIEVMIERLIHVAERRVPRCQCRGTLRLVAN